MSPCSTLLSFNWECLHQIKISAGLCKLVNGYKSAVSVTFEGKKTI